MSQRIPIVVLLLVAGAFAGPAHAYVDPVSGRTAFHVLSILFILGSAAFVFLKNQVVRLFRKIAELLGRILR